jgi:hypothetical protein
LTKTAGGVYHPAVDAGFLKPQPFNLMYFLLIQQTHHFKFAGIHEASGVACHDKVNARKVMLIFGG